MKYFYVISNLSKDYVLDVQDEVQSCLEKRGAVCRYMTDYERMKNGRHTPGEYVPEDTIIDTIEKVPIRIKCAKENFERYGKNDRITLYEGDAVDVLKKLAAEGRKYDFIFMDAAKGQYLNFLEPVLDMLTDDGLLVTDNVLQDGDIIQSRYAITKRDRTIHGRMREYLYFLTHSERFKTVVLPVGDGAALSQVIRADRKKE